MDADIQGYFDSIDQKHADGTGEGANLGSKGIEVDPPVVGSGSDGGRHGEGNAGGNTAGRSDLAVAGQHLPEQAGSDLGGEVWVARDTGSVCRRFRGDVPNGVAGEGSASADRAGDEPAGSETASGEDADGGLETWEGELCVSGLHDSKEAKHTAESARAFHAAVAVAEGDEANPGTRAGVDRFAAQRERREADHRDAESRAPGMGKLLPDGERRTEVQSTGQLRLPAADPLDVRRGGQRAADGEVDP